MRSRILIVLHAEAKINFVETHVGLLAFPASGFAHAEEHTLRHGWHCEYSEVALGSSADGPCARWVALLEQVLDRVAIGILKMVRINISIFCNIVQLRGEDSQNP